MAGSKPPLMQSLQDLQDALAQGTHRERVRTMVQLGRRAIEDPQAADWLARLSELTPHHRQMSLFGLQAAGDGQNLCRLAQEDPSLRLRCRAIKAAACVATDGRLLELLDQLPAKARQRLLRQLQRRNRQLIIDRWVETQEEVPLQALAYASARVLEVHRDLLLERGTEVEWTRLVRRQPEWTLSVFLQGERDLVAVRRVSCVTLTLAKARSPWLWQAWQAARAAGYQGDLSEETLFRACPVTAASWAVETYPEEDEGFGSTSSLPDWPFLCGAARYPLPVLLDLYRRGEVGNDHRWWKRRTLEERLRLWEEMRASLSWTDGSLNPLWLHRLDASTRMREARFQATLPVLEMDPKRQAAMLSMLGADEGHQALAPFLANPDVDQRVAGVTALVGLAQHQGEYLPEVLRVLLGRRNEPDPVRAAFLGALAALPPSRWTSSHLPAVTELLDGLLAAADASAQSFSMAEALILRLLPHHTSWAAGQMARLLRHWGRTSGSLWVFKLHPPGSAKALDLTLSEVLRDWLSRDRHAQAFGLLRCLETALQRMPRVRELAVGLCQSTQPEVASQALACLWKGDAPAARALLPSLLQQDPSWIGQPQVAVWMHRHRQDLLTPYLQGEVMGGRFASGRTSWVLSFSTEFWRWTPHQQRLYEAQLAGLLGDLERDFPAQSFSLRSLAGLPDVAPTALAAAGSLAESRQAVRDEALRCLARTEDGKGVPSLVEALEDERARVAIYALRQVILAMPAPAALRLLSELSSPKVTVNKEIARLLGDLPQATGVPSLLERLRGETHRDVRLALLRGLWPHLDREEVWEPFWRASESPDPAVGMALSAVPIEGLGRAARARVEQLLLRLLSHPDRRVRATVLRRLASAPARPEQGELLEACASFLSDPQDRFTAAGALFEALASSPQEWETAIERTRPNRAGLEALVNAVRFRQASHQGNPRYPDLLQATERCLAAEPELLRLRLSLLAGTGGMQALLTAVESAIDEEPGNLEIPLNWASLLRDATYHLSELVYRQVRDRWVGDQRPVLRRLCLETLLVHVKTFGWKESSRTDLRRHYQNDPSPLVRGPAQFQFPPPAPEVAERSVRLSPS